MPDFATRKIVITVEEIFHEGGPVAGACRCAAAWRWR